jgi:uncharacterized protein (DUF58 family)
VRALWRRLARRLRPRRRLRLTREGRLYLAITIGIGLAAINTGNNLLYLLLGWLLSLIVASGALSNMTLRGLAVTRRAPPRIHAGRPFLMEIALENQKRHRASYSIEIEDLAGGKPVDKRCYFLKLPAGRQQRASYRHTFHRRGLYKLDGFRVSTRFPFALFAKSRDVTAVDEILVLPAVRPVPLPPARARRLGDAPQQKLGRRGEFFGLREYRDGDDSRGIHWRSSARGGRLMVRELEEEAQRRVALEVDNAVADATDEAELDALEEAVSHAASLALAYLRAGFAVKLSARGTSVPSGAGAAQEQRLLRALALLEPAAPGTPLAGGPHDPHIELVRVTADARRVIPRDPVSVSRGDLPGET